MAEFQKAATTGEIPPGTVKAVEIHGWRIALFNVDGHFYALEDLCPHEGAPLSEGTMEGDEVECPWHSASFNIRTGQVLTPPAVEDVRTFEVRVQEGEIQVLLPSPA
jgi:3-phenylpropionate/trans-cinnamate dioxygenase ferredoxin component